jgi:quercetin dioxygenase-like cupin family protein
MRITLVTILLLSLALAGCADSADAPADVATTETAAPADDLSALGSDAVESLLTEESIHVHRVTLDAGASLPPHDGGQRVVYALTELPSLVFVTDGEREERSFAQGEVHRHDAGVHTVENASDSEASFVVFERRGDLPDASATGDTDIPAPGEGVEDEVLLDDDFAEVHRVTMQPGASLPPHTGYARAIYSLSGYTVEFTGPDGTTEQRFDAGDAHMHMPGDHTVENAGETVAEFLVVEFKR